MQQAWREFLIRTGAVLGEYGVSRFDDTRAESAQAAAGDIIADLSHLSLLRARGTDTAAFLQAQLSNDLELLQSSSQLHAYSNAQGRMLAIFRVFQHADAFLLQLHGSLLLSTLKRLQMFVLRARVTLDSADAELGRIGLSGPNLGRLLGRLDLPLPEAPAGARSRRGLVILRLPGVHPRCQIVGPVEILQDLWERLPECRPVGAPAWRWLDIIAGVPNLYPATVEKFVPQMANLDLLGGISFNKGCYPGQEIVARMQYRGHLKQRLYRAHLAGASMSQPMPQPGDTLFAPNFPGQGAGTVVDAQAAPEGGSDLLAVIQISSVENGELHWGSADGPRLTILAGPETQTVAG